MTTIEECRAALDKLSDSMQRRRGRRPSRPRAMERSVSCHVTDLDVTFAGRLTGGRIEVRDTVPRAAAREGADDGSP
ncbi:hypothetical protein GCM10019016_110730 [Streptomyces prasinosporus]|uniref:Uncharacterized protein n=1 Tax=Streptomyces prasinosporus TaxID=68256 RepID=A0ABP6UAK3_9ACTN